MLRLFGPPEDRVRDIFYGSQTNPVQERKIRELEMKKAYAAELQAQMREKEQQRQLDRVHRLGAASGAQSRISQIDSSPPAAFAAQAPFVPGDTSPTAAASNMPDWPAAPASYHSSPHANGTSMQQPASAACYQPYGSPYSVSYITADPYTGAYSQQAGYAPAGWPDRVMQPPGAPFSPHSGNPAAACQAGYNIPGRQSQVAMPAAAPIDMYNTVGTYGPAAPAAGNSASPPWAQPPANFAPSSMMGPAGGYAPDNSIYRSRTMAAAGPGSISSPSWGAAGTSTAMPEASPAASAAKARKDAYRAELEAQIKDKAERKAAEKNALAAEEARREAELAGYNPWGKGGAGAPLRDESGLVVCNIRGRPAVQQQMQAQQQHQHQHQQQQQAMRQRSTYQQSSQSFEQAEYNPPVDMSGYWGGTGEAATEQQLQQPSASNIRSSAAPSSAPGPPPLLNFRSDKAFMTADEVERRQRAQLELQKELDQQIQEKKRRKELEQQQAEEEARREDERLAAEQARLTAQFEQEQNKERAKANKTADVEQVAGAWSAAKATAAQERRRTMEERRRSLGHVDNDTPVTKSQQQGLQHGQSSLRASDQEQGRSSFHATSNQQQQQPCRTTEADVRQAAIDTLQQFQIPQQQERQQLMLEALRLEEEKMRQVAAQELQRLRADMEAQTASLRDVVERQGGEVAALRAAAATAEAESLAAKSELMQERQHCVVRQDILRRSQEMQHETLSTILADYGNGPVSRISAAYHPSPIRRVDLDLPPPAASVRRSVQLQGEAAAAAECALDAFVDGGVPAVELTSSSWQQSRHPVEDLSAVYQLERAGGAVAGAGSCVSRHHRHAPMPAAPAAAAAALGGTTMGKSWISTVPVSQADNLRGSMLVSESTFIFPTGIAADVSPAAQPDSEGDAAAATAADCLDGNVVGVAAGVYSSSSALEIGSHWGLWQKQQPGLQRHTLSAPGSSQAAGNMAGQLVSSNRTALLTPGGSDLTSVMDRNANRLQLLDGMSAAGTSEELDDFLAKFVNKTSQPNQRNIATPPSRLLSAHGHSHQQQQHTVQLLQQPPDKRAPARYGFGAEAGVNATGAQGATALANAAEAASSSVYLGIADTLEQELSRIQFG